MKKLLDETSDDLTRALLDAGRSHRPPATNQAKLLVVLGVAGGVGLFSSKAFAWLGSSGGKLTLLGVSLGVAGAVYTALPNPAAPVQLSATSSPAASLATEADTLRAGVPPALSAPALPAASSVPALVADAPLHPRLDAPLSSFRGAKGVLVRREHAPAASESPRRVSREGKSTAARRDDVSQTLESQPEGPLPAASAPPPAVGAPPEPVPAARAPGLDSEILLVDAMRGAAQANDAPALRRLVQSYRGTFPEGQLRQEVSELALRALQPGPH
jgi:hypothetical protein